MSRYQFTHEGERWWVGYDVADATFFLDRDADLDRDDYHPGRLPTFEQLMAAATVPIPCDILDKLRRHDPIDVTAAQASVIARVDQVSAAVRASYPQTAVQAANQRPLKNPQEGHHGPYVSGRGGEFGLGR